MLNNPSVQFFIVAVFILTLGLVATSYLSAKRDFESDSSYEEDEYEYTKEDNEASSRRRL